MESRPRPDIVFQQSIFAVEKIKEKWPHLGNLITCRDHLAAALDRAASDPKWQRDPLLARMAPGTAKEVLDFYNAVVADGRYVAELQTDPRGVAKKLRYDVSDLAFETIKSIIPLPGDQENPGLVVVGGGIVVVGLAAATAVANYTVDPRKQIVIDESGIVKI